MSHTPGPWHVRSVRGLGPNGAHIYSGDLVICRMSPKADSSIETKETNAHLIAQAWTIPALRAALEEATLRMQSLGQDVSQQQDALALANEPADSPHEE